MCATCVVTRIKIPVATPAWEWCTPCSCCHLELIIAYTSLTSCDKMSKTPLCGPGSGPGNLKIGTLHTCLDRKRME